MNFHILTLVIVVVSQAQAGILTRANAPWDLVDVELLSASLVNSISAKVNLYGINSPGKCILPITDGDKKAYTFLWFDLPPRPQSRTPVWNTTAGFPNELFDLQSYFVIELWQQITNSEVQYSGGVTFTFAEMEMHAQQYSVQLQDNVGQNVGTVTLRWGS